MSLPHQARVDFEDEHAGRKARGRNRQPPYVDGITARRRMAGTRLVTRIIEIVGGWRRNGDKAPGQSTHLLHFLLGDDGGHHAGASGGSALYARADELCERYERAGQEGCRNECFNE